MTERIVGIDLGTTNSLVGAVVEGRPTLFADAAGHELLPSVVGAEGPSGPVVVGRAAKNRRLLDPTGTVASIKRSMGRDARSRIAGRDLSPPEISALILGALLDRAEAALGARPARAVITVPAFFDDLQRAATRDAGEIAGVVVERLVNEPTAAAMTYQSGREERVLVYDLGGGTFDVSILDRDEGFLEVRSSRGDTHLGGDDVDEALGRLVMARLGAAADVVRGDAAARTRLTEAVERAKIALSERTEVRLSEPFLAGSGASAVHLDMLLTRSDVESVAKPFVERTLTCIDEALREAKMSARDLDRVLLVGGSSKMPFVAALVANHLGRAAHVDADADRAVALGATIIAGRAAGEPIDEVLVDITPHTLAAGVVTPDRDELEASPVIAQGSVLPVARTRTYSTVVDNQRTVIVPIVQGESELVDDNTWLGEVTVDRLPPSPRGSPVEVSFTLDLSGVLQVAARHVPSGKAASVTLDNCASRLTTMERRAGREVVDELRAATPSPRAADETERRLAEAMLGRARQALGRTGVDADAASRAAAAVARVEARLVEGGDVVEATEALSDALLDLL
jgi:molecular chaperone DnaK